MLSVALDPLHPARAEATGIRTMKLLPCLRAACATLLVATSAFAGDRYATLTLAELDCTEGGLPEVSLLSFAHFERIAATRPYGRLDGAGELYVCAPEANVRSPGRSSDASGFRLAVRVPDSTAGSPVSGRLYVAEPGATGMRRLEFTVPERAFGATRADFLDVQLSHYEALLERRHAGAAWFRHRARAAREELGRVDPERARARPARPLRGDVQDTYELFTGGRAVAENLQLERDLAPADEGEEVHRLADLPGVETAAYDWSAEIEGLEPELDPLARWIPADQHAVFAASFEEFVAVLDDARREGSPLLQLVERSSTDARTRQRYEAQLCLPLDGRARALGPLVVRSLAMTGSDPYLRTGSDVAFLFEAQSPRALEAFLFAEHERALADDPESRRVDGEAGGLTFRGVRSPDRSVCSYVARLEGDVVVVTNSTVQLARLAAVRSGAAPALGELDEYVFFRSRYERGAGDESLLVVVSDATLRRWTGPRWRIGAARRTRAAAWLAEAQASWLAHELGVADTGVPATLFDGSPLEGGERGLRSERWGSTSFLTPIAELDLEHVTTAEKEAYERFRIRYQNGWRAWFDPIALRIARRGTDLELDLTVRPLISGSDYRRWMDVVGAGTLAPLGADPHAGTLVQFAMAVDPGSGPFDMARGLLSSGRASAGDGMFGWVGDGVSLSLEDDAFLAEWRAAAAEDEADVWLEDNLARLPLVLYVESKDPLRLAAFLLSLRGLVDQSAPSLTEWSNHQHGELTYVRVGASDSGRGNLGAMGDLAIWYASLPDAWIVSLREDLLLRALDRRATREPDAEAGTAPWRGSSLALRVDEGLLDLIGAIDGENELLRQQRASWSALPLLREWRALAPDEDALELHRRLFGARPLEPAGGRYTWDAEWDTFTSSVYGHPGAPIDGPVWPAALEALRAVDFGVTFEADGLRARALLQRD